MMSRGWAHPGACHALPRRVGIRRGHQAAETRREEGDLLPMAKARGIPPLGRTPNALPAPQAPAYLPMAKARGITQDLVRDVEEAKGAWRVRDLSGGRA